MIKSIALTRLQLGETHNLGARIMQLIDNNALTTPGFEQVSTPFTPPRSRANPFAW